MALVVKDRVKETTNTTGTSTFELEGAVTGFLKFDDVMTNNGVDTTYYACTDNTNWEVGIGTFNDNSSGKDTLTRDTVLASSNSGSKVSWSSGTRTIFMTYPADKAVFKDASNNINGTFVGDITGDVTGNADTATTLANARTIAGQSFNGGANITIASTDLSDTASIALLTSTQTLTNKTLTSPKINEDAVLTSTATELNLLDGVSGLVQADFTKLAAIDSSSGELNLLDGSAKSTASITIADADAFIVIDDDTTKQIPASDLKTYINAGDITGVTAGVGISGGGSSGAVTLTLDLSELSDVTPVNGDKLATLDSDGSTEQLTTVASLATLFAGTGLTASNSVIGVNASQTQITGVGTIGTGTWQGTAIASTYIADDAITEAKIADDAVESEHLNNNVISGQTEITTGLADADELLYSDGGSIKRVGMDTLKTYFSPVAGSSSIVTTGALDSGSITSNFGSINNGSSAITTTGTVTYGSLSDGSITITAFVDENDMNSDSATLVPTQQSVKAYVDANSGGMTSFVLEDGDTTEVTIGDGKEVKFVEGGGLNINWTDTSNGSDGDPYDLTFTINAAQTDITSVVNTSLEIGRDADNRIKFGTDNQIIFEVDGGDNVIFKTSGEIEASSLDISGNADIDGTLYADAISSAGGITFETGTHGIDIGSSSNSDVTIIRTGNDATQYGFNIKYMGSGTGNFNRLSIFTDQQTGGLASLEAVQVFQDGSVKFDNTVFVGDNIDLTSDGAILKIGVDDDVTLTHVHDTGLLLNGSRQLQFGDSGTYIHQSADGVLDLVSDTEIEINATTIDINGAVDASSTITAGGRIIVDDTTNATSTTDGSIQTDGGLSVVKDIVVGDDILVGDNFALTSDACVIYFGADSEITLTHVHNTGLRLNSSATLQFGDSGTYIHQSADGVLDLVSDTEIEINATTIDINGAVVCDSVITATGFTIGSAAITEAELEILNGASVTTTELNYVDGVTSAIQTQLDAKASAGFALAMAICL